MPQYQFRPMCADDLPLLREWLARPHVVAWWHDADEFAFVSGDLGHHDIAQFIARIERFDHLSETILELTLEGDTAHALVDQRTARQQRLPGRHCCGRLRRQ